MAEIYTNTLKVWQFINLYTTITAEEVGIGDGVNKMFPLEHKYVINNTETVYVSGVLKTKDVDYTIDNDSGTIVFNTAPANLAPVVASYLYADVADSAVRAYIERVQDEIDRRVGRSFRPPVSITEYYDAESIIDISPYTYQPTTFNQDMEMYKSQWEEPYLNKYIKLNHYPVTKVTSLQIIKGVSGGITTYEDIELPPGGATEATNDTANILIYSDEGKIVLRNELGKRLKRGQMNIKITYEYGYNTVPFVVEDLATKMTALYVIESRLLGSPQPLSIPASNIRAIKEDIDDLFETLGTKLDIKVV